MKLKSKVILVTGAGCGFGLSRAIPEGFAREGSHLVLNCYEQSREGMADMKRQLEAYGIEVVLVEGDITQEDTVRAMVNAAMERFGRMDILINNAGIAMPMSIGEMPPQVWHRVMDVDLTSVYLTCHHVVPQMIRQRWGRIINISSQIGQRGLPDHCHYAAAKAGMIGFTKALAREVGEYGITANCIAPGPIETQVYASTGDEEKAKTAQRLVIARFGNVEEVVPTAIFLASEPDGNLYTGQTLGPCQGDVMP